MDYYNKYKKLIVLFTIIITMVTGAVLYVFLYYYTDSKKEVITFIEEPVLEKEVEVEEEPLPLMIKVDIKGMVNLPGVYELEEGKRVIDVINAAGGLKEGANTEVNNLSKKIYDEMVIIIYSDEEVDSFTKILEEEEIEEEKCKDYNSNITNDSCIEKEDTVINEIDQKISINEATQELLITLPSIGEAKANSIIEYREENGPFQKIEDIMNVSGIGESLFEKIKDYITV